MKNITYLLAATLVVGIQGVTIAAELTENISNVDLSKLQNELCNNSTVTQTLANNVLDDIYIPPATGGGDDDDGAATVNVVQPISAQEVLTSLCS